MAADFCCIKSANEPAKVRNIRYNKAQTRQAETYPP